MSRRTLSRRGFLQRVSAGAAAATAVGPSLGGFAWGSPAATAPAKGDPLYAFVVLGDMHYDRPGHHDMEWVRKAKGDGDAHQIEGYCKATELHTPQLMRRVREVIAQRRVAMPFVLQVGDLVEGLCGSYELAARQVGDAIEMVEQAKLGAPMLMCKGNHDVTGPGAAEAFDKILLPWMGRQAGQTLSSAAYVHRQGDDAFVFFDAYKPDLEGAEAAFREHKDARHTFFVVHPPVVPYDDRSNWILFASERDRAKRERLLKMLGGRGALVIGGHIHKYSVAERQTDAGRFPQLAVCSVIRDDAPKPRSWREGVGAYKDDELLAIEPNFSPTTHDARREILEKERAFIRRYEYADLPGYAIVSVYGDRVECDVFAGAEEKPWRSPRLVGAGV
jgi:hypothetical protein